MCSLQDRLVIQNLDAGPVVIIALPEGPISAKFARLLKTPATPHAVILVWDLQRDQRASSGGSGNGTNQPGNHNELSETVHSRHQRNVSNAL